MNRLHRKSIAWVALLAATWGCNFQLQQPKPAASAAAKPKPTVEVDSPRETEVIDFEDFTGRTMASETIGIRARVTGYLEKIHFTEGADVKEGQLLYEIDDGTYQAQVEQAEGELSRTKAHPARLDLDLKRAESLLPAKNISREDYDRIAGDRSEAAAAVMVSKAALDLARTNLNYTRIKAPISGRLSRTQLDPGNLVKADESLLTTIVRIDPIYAYFGVDERLLDRVRIYIREGVVSTDAKGSATVSMGLAIENNTFPHPGEINFIDNQLDSATGTLQVRGVFPNKDHAILPGLFARVRLPLGQPYQALTVPDTAVQIDQGQKFVYVVNGENKVEYRKVEIGKLQDGARVIHKGLAAGDRVIVRGVQRVHPDDVVELKAVQMTSGGDAPADKAVATEAKELSRTRKP